jgi:hypothetical protein
MPKTTRSPKEQTPNLPAPGADFKPAEQMIITTPEQLKAISEPLHLDILEQIQSQALTVKQIATRLSQPVTRLYYHVTQLEENGFVTVVETRVKSGIIEKYYRGSAESIRLDHNLLAKSTQGNENLRNILATVLDGTSEDLQRSFASGLIQLGMEESGKSPTTLLARSILNIRPEDVPVFINRFKALVDELGVEEESAETIRYACTIAFYPRSRPGKKGKNAHDTAR